MPRFSSMMLPADEWGLLARLISGGRNFLSRSLFLEERLKPVFQSPAEDSRSNVVNLLSGHERLY